MVAPLRGCGNRAPQATWVFSSDAGGLYRMRDLEIVQAGRNEPLGEITLRAKKGIVSVPAGSGLLLRVNPISR
jgi:hypothetical protein